MTAIAPSTAPASRHVPLATLPQPKPDAPTQDAGKTRDTSHHRDTRKVDLTV